MRNATCSRPSRSFVALAVSLLALATLARAQSTALWTNGTSATANWNDPANWFNGIYGFGQAGAVVSFNNTDLSGPQTVILDGTYTIGTFSVGDNTGTRYPYTFSGGTLAFNRSGAAAAYNQGANTGPAYLNSAVQLVDDLTFTIQNNASLTITGSITGNRALTKAELGTLILTGPVNESTNVTLTRGTLQLGDGGTTGTLGSGTVTMSNSSVLRFNRSDNVSVSNTLAGVGIVEQAGTGTVSLTGANTFSAGIRLTAGTLEVGSTGAIGNFGTITFNGGTLRYSADNTTDYSARFSTAVSQLYRVDTNGQNVVLASALTSSSGTLTKLSTGTLTLTGTNTYDGVTTIAGGTLQIGDGNTSGSLGSGVIANNSSLAFNRSDDTSFSNLISGSGSFTKLGSGTLTLAGSNTYSGGTTISAGTLALGSANALGSGNVTINSGATLAFNRSDSFTITNQISGSGSLAKQGTGTLTLTGDSTFSGPISIEAGTLQLGNGGTTGSLSSPLELSGPNLSSHLILNRSDSFTFTNSLNGSGTLTKLGAGQLTFLTRFSMMGNLVVSAGSVSFGNGGAFGNDLPSALTLSLQNNTSVIFNHSDNISYAPYNFGGGSGSLIKRGSGNLSLSGYSQYSLGVFIEAGSLTLRSEAAAGYGNITNNGTLILDLSSSTTLSNLISGSGNLVKTGSGTTTLFESNSYTGGTTVSAGSLVVGAGYTSGSLGSGNVSIGPGATLVFNRSDAFTVSNLLSGSGSLSKLGSGTLNLSGNNSYSGGTYLGSGTTRINNLTGSAFGTGAVTVEAGATLAGSGSFTGALQLNGTFSPGNSPGLATIGSGSVLGGLTLMEIAGTSRGVTYDAINVGGAGALTFGGTLQLTLLDGYSPISGTSFQLFQATTYSGAFATLDLPALTPGLSWDTSQLASAGTLSVSASAIPEPSTYAALAGLAALGLAALRRRPRSP